MIKNKTKTNLPQVHTGTIRTEYVSKMVLLKMLNSCTPVKYILLPVVKKLPDLVDAIFVHELIDNVYLWLKLSRTIIDPRVTYSIIPDRFCRIDELSHLKLERLEFGVDSGEILVREDWSMR